MTGVQTCALPISLYDWFIKELEIYAPRQIEFARLNLSYTVMSKRKLLNLVKGGYVRGWDDPRMPPFPVCAGGAIPQSQLEDSATGSEWQRRTVLWIMPFWNP